MASLSYINQFLATSATSAYNFLGKMSSGSSFTEAAIEICFYKKNHKFKNGREISYNFGKIQCVLFTL